MGSIGWAPIRHDWRPCKKRILGYTEGQPREVTEKTAVCQRLGLRGGPSPPCHRGLVARGPPAASGPPLPVPSPSPRQGLGSFWNPPASPVSRFSLCPHCLRSAYQLRLPSSERLTTQERGAHCPAVISTPDLTLCWAGPLPALPSPASSLGLAIGQVASGRPPGISCFLLPTWALREALQPGFPSPALQVPGQGGCGLCSSGLFLGRCPRCAWPERMCVLRGSWVQGGGAHPPPGLGVIHIKHWAPLFPPAGACARGALVPSGLANYSSARARPSRL